MDVEEAEEMALEVRRRVDPLALLDDQLQRLEGRGEVGDRKDVDLIFDRHEHLLIGIARVEVPVVGEEAGHVLSPLSPPGERGRG